MKVKGFQTQMTTAVARKKLKFERGFSLLELMVVLAMLMVIAATAAPSMINVISTARMRGSMSSMATYAQRVRGDAVRSNKTKSLWNVNSSGEYFLYSADAASTAPGLTAADGMLPAGKQVVFIGTPTAASVPTILDPTTAFGSATAAINSPQI